MTRREPTIHNRALTVRCPRCGCVPGARCMDTRGHWLKDGKAHRDRTELYRDREAGPSAIDLDLGPNVPHFNTIEEAEAWADTEARRQEREAGR